MPVTPAKTPTLCAKLLAASACRPTSPVALIAVGYHSLYRFVELKNKLFDGLI